MSETFIMQMCDAAPACTCISEMNDIGAIAYDYKGAVK